MEKGEYVLEQKFRGLNYLEFSGIGQVFTLYPTSSITLKCFSINCLILKLLGVMTIGLKKCICAIGHFSSLTFCVEPIY